MKTNFMKHSMTREQAPLLQSQLRRRREAGFTLMELLIVISIMLILMLIAIPNFAGMKMQANETSAIQSLRAIYQAQIQYQTNYPANGFAPHVGDTGGRSQVGAALSTVGATAARRPDERTEERIHLRHREPHEGYGEQSGYVHRL